MKRRFTKYPVNASADNDTSDLKSIGKWLLNELKNRGIDTAKHKYEWKYTYGNFQNNFGSQTFYAPGDWIACFAFWGFVPTIENIIENIYEGDIEWFHEEFASDYLNRSLSDMISDGSTVADERAMGPGIATTWLKNLDTGEVFFEADLDDYYDEQEEDDYDW